MSITYYEHSEGINLMVKFLHDKKLTPIIGSGFTKNCKTKKANVPDSKQATKIMKDIISEYKKINLSDADFNKTSERFFAIVPKERRLEYFEKYFTKVMIPQYLSDFLKLPWSYIYTLNVDDGIEETGFYTPVLPYKNANVPNTSLRLVYKLHGDAIHEILYQEQKNIVFSVSQYIETLTSNDNKTIYNAIRSDYTQKNILFIGCSLANEPDLKYIYSHVSEDISPNILRCIIRTDRLEIEEELDLEGYGINSVIVVKDYELFYHDFVKEYEKLVAKETMTHYRFTNPKTILIDEDNKILNIKYFSGENIFDITKNVFYKSNLQIMRKCVRTIETYISENNSIIIQGRRFSGKTLVLSMLAERCKKYTVLYFPSECMIEEESLHSILENSTDTLLLFDSNSLSDYAYQMVAHSEKLLEQNNNKLVIATNTNDIYLSDTLDAETVLIPASFNDNELRIMGAACDKYGLSKRRPKETNIDYLKRLSDDQKIDFSIFNKLPTKYSQQEQVLLMLLCIKDKIYFSDIIALDISFHEVDCFVNRLQGIVERIPTSKGEKAPHSSEKLVHNSKYYLLSLMKNFTHNEIIDTVRYIVLKLSKDSAKKRLYIEAVLFDTLNQLFGHNKGSGELIVDIYDAIDPYLNQDMDYWLQRAKCIYRLYRKDYNKLRAAYQYAKKAASDGEPRIQAKAALTISLICCLLAKQCNKDNEKYDFEIEAISSAEMAITSDYFKINKKILKGELGIGKRKSYYEMIIELCNKYFNASKDLEITWKANAIKKNLIELVETVYNN